MKKEHGEKVVELEQKSIGLSSALLSSKNSMDMASEKQNQEVNVTQTTSKEQKKKDKKEKRRLKKEKAKQEEMEKKIELKMKANSDEVKLTEEKRDVKRSSADEAQSAT